MRPSTIGGYQGPVVILTPDDRVLAEAACRYRAEEDTAATDHWQGRLHRIEPRDAVVAGQYRVRFPTGELGDITIAVAMPGSDVVYFEGIGRRPLGSGYVAQPRLADAEQARGTAAAEDGLA